MHSYEKDVVAWANEQAEFIRVGRFDLLDIEHIADEIEDVGKSEQRELQSRLIILVSHLLKWQFQPERRGASWQRTIKVQRKDLAYALKKMPSLKASFSDPEWLDITFEKSIAKATEETGLETFPDQIGWSIEKIMDNEFWPQS